MALDGSSLHTEALHPDFGVKITGVDMTVRSPELVAEVRDLIDQYGFLWFPEQSFDDDKQLSLTRDLGDPEPAHVAAGEGKLEYHGTIGNVQPDGSVLGNDATKTKFLKGNNMWHSDASFKAVPAFVSIMCAYETPDEGGETLFVSTRGAWKRLSPERQAALEPLITIHDYTFSRSKVAEVPASLSAVLPPVRQRLVRTNRAVGEKNLFIGSHVSDVEGMDADESRALLDQLVDEAVAEPNIYAHKWAPGDLVIWDNRCLIHRGAGYDADKYRRHMRQTRVSGECSTLEE
ncbi:MAG: TauD/TfdA family dioxygenase [Pseudomonadota bacterium]